MTAGTDLLAYDLDDVLLTFAASATETLLVVAPFVKAARLKALLGVVPLATEVRVLTRWRADEVAAGVSDLEVLDVCVASGADLRLCDRLHAKLYVADGERALVGSANLTGAGLGVASRSNLELLVEIRPTPASLRLFEAALLAESRPATLEEARQVAEEASLMDRPTGEPSNGQVAARMWLPSFRSPDRLHAVYEGLNDEALVREPEALSDLVALRIPAGLDREPFHELVAGRLRRAPVASALGEHLQRPRRFGEVTAWLERHRPAATFVERQRLTQTLIRWLLFFDGGRFRLDVPSHSEILSFREG